MFIVKSTLVGYSGTRPLVVRPIIKLLQCFSCPPATETSIGYRMMLFLLRLVVYSLFILILCHEVKSIRLFFGKQIALSAYLGVIAFVVRAWTNRMNCNAYNEQTTTFCESCDTNDRFDTTRRMTYNMQQGV